MYMPVEILINLDGEGRYLQWSGEDTASITYARGFLKKKKEKENITLFLEKLTLIISRWNIIDSRFKYFQN